MSVEESVEPTLFECPFKDINFTILANFDRLIKKNFKHKELIRLAPEEVGGVQIRPYFKTVLFHNFKTLDLTDHSKKLILNIETREFYVDFIKSKEVIEHIDRINELINMPDHKAFIVAGFYTLYTSSIKSSTEARIVKEIIESDNNGLEVTVVNIDTLDKGLVFKVQTRESLRLESEQTK